ncbi:hypothetical protein EVAR_7908_1 [Eumeta japonica]|uniref:Uncharacterized protein n=1 Tax=Eumeta variegata TaxID=151549 RepID=A0A4C1TV60_EUMVA|nr:hypothetical protein EVAR_7908_1 [Eumeta japonica]
MARTYPSKRGIALYRTYKRSLDCCPIDIPRRINMEATGCRLAIMGHGFNRHSLGLSPSHQTIASERLALLALEDAILFGDFHYPYIVKTPGGDVRL